MLRPIGLPLLGAAAIAAGADSAAAPVEYVLDLPAHERLSYEIEFEVAFPGRVHIEAAWSPGRVLVFRLDRPGAPPLRRSGPPPQSLEVDVAAHELVPDVPWTLSIDGLPSREAAGGRLTLGLPDSPETTEQKEEEQRRATEPPPPSPDPWTLPAEPPPGIGRDRLRLYDATEAFRQRVVGPVADRYRWQGGMLQFLADRRDATAAGPAVARPSALFLERVVETVEDLDALRQAENQPLAGPAPTDGVRLRAWNSVRDPRFLPIEEELDRLMAELHSGHAPELETEFWLTNLLSCVIVCERQFEERARLGREPAAGAELVREQWDTVLAGVDALEALLAQN